MKSNGRVLVILRGDVLSADGSLTTTKHLSAPIGYDEQMSVLHSIRVQCVDVLWKEVRDLTLCCCSEAPSKARTLVAKPYIRSPLNK